MLMQLLFLATQAQPAKPQAPAAIATGGWVTSTSVSTMDDSKTVVLALRALQPISGWPGRTRIPSLIARCKEAAIETYITTGMAPAVEGSGDYATARIRLDQEPAIETGMTTASDGEALFFGNAKETLLVLAAHKRLLFRFTPFNSSPQETTFNLAGLRAALKPLQAACGWDPQADAAAQAKAEAVQAQAEQARAQEDLSTVRDAAVELAGAKDADQRAMAARRIGLSPQGVTALTALIAALKDPEVEVRRAAAITIGGLGPSAREAEAPLQEAIADGTSGIMMDAMKALAQIRGKEP